MDRSTTTLICPLLEAPAVFGGERRAESAATRRQHEFVSFQTRLCNRSGNHQCGTQQEDFGDRTAKPRVPENRSLQPQVERDRLAESRASAGSSQTSRRRLVAGKTPGALHGVPVTIKESFAYRGSPNTWGLPPLKNAMSPRTAVAVERLESAGAIVLGKTNVSTMLAIGRATTQSTELPTIPGILTSRRVDRQAGARLRWPRGLGV
jgi:Amidase